MQSVKPRILVTNDDGIQSPAIWTMAEALAAFAEVTIIAPTEQFSGAGRSYTGNDGSIERVTLPAGSRIYAAYSVGTTPAKAVLWGLIQHFAGSAPDLVVSGINYGENPGGSITASGTVGAAMEAAVNGVRAMAISRCVPPGEYHSYSDQYDFSTAAHFTVQFAKSMLYDPAFAEIEILKLDVPAEATPATPTKLTRLSQYRYYEPVLRHDAAGNQVIEWITNPHDARITPDDDVYALLHEQVVTVTPLSMDMTAQDPFTALLRRREQAII